MSAPLTSGRSQVRALPWPLTARSSAGPERPAPTGEAARSTRAARIGKDQPTAGAGRGLENRRAHLAPWEFDPPSFRFGAVMYRPHSELLTRLSGFDSYRLYPAPIVYWHRHLSVEEEIGVRFSVGALDRSFPSSSNGRTPPC